MRSGRAALPHALFVALVAAATTLAALLSWRVFLIGPSQYLAPLTICGVLVAASGALLRRAGVPWYLVPLVQLLLAAVYVCGEVAGSVLPTHATFSAFGDAMSAAMHSARTYKAPIGPGAAPVAPLLIVCGSVFLLLVDLIACTLRKVPLAGLPLLAIYSVPAGLTDSGPGVLAFVGAAVGFLVLLHVDARDDLLRWGRPLGPAETSPWAEANPVSDAVRAGAGRIGVAATALALVVPVFVPVLNLDLFGLGPGSGNGDITIHHPQVDMRKDLEQGEDVPLVRMTTDDPDPHYLRIAVLNWFTGDEWTSGDRDVSTDQQADGALPPPQGLSEDVPTRTYDYQVTINDNFKSYWLPTMFPATSVTSSDDWRYDLGAMDFISADDDLTTAGASYSMTAITPEYGTTGAFFRNSVTGDVSSKLTEVPEGLPTVVARDAVEVTRRATSDYEAAVLLQQWFRHNFTYSVEDAPAGTGGGTFETFLEKGPDGRVGYCEQFASAMAVMARIVGIPARVAVGFYEPQKVGSDTWEYSSHDLHAWPELYFEGAGWVRFEPTPSERATAVPDYTRIHVEGGGSDIPSRTHSNLPDEEGANGHGANTPTTAPDQPRTAHDHASSGSDGNASTTVLLVVLGLVLLLLLAALLPRVLRARIRARRLAGAPEEVWAELAATVVDLRVPWPTGRSPREIGAVLLEHMAGHAEPVNRLVSRIELARYARPGSVVSEPSAELTADGETCVEALFAGAVPKAQRRATWLPRSLWRAAASDEVRPRVPISR